MCFTFSYKNTKELCENSIYSWNRFGSVRIEGGSRHSLERSHDSRDMLDFERRNRSMHDLQRVLSVLQDSRPRCSGRLGSRRLRHMQLHSRGWKSEFRNLLFESASLRYAWPPWQLWQSYRGKSASKTFKRCISYLNDSTQFRKI